MAIFAAQTLCACGHDVQRAGPPAPSRPTTDGAHRAATGAVVAVLAEQSVGQVVSHEELDDVLNTVHDASAVRRRADGCRVASSTVTSGAECGTQP